MSTYVTTVLVQHLHYLFVKELLTDRCKYSTFLVDSDKANWEGEVKKFLNHGHFNSFIAMANALHLNMVIIPVDDC